MLSLVFPGQGSQCVGMGHQLSVSFPDTRLIFEEINDVLHQDLTHIMWEGSPQEINATENAQPALLAVSAAALFVLKKEFGLQTEGRSAQFLAGHSVGEWCALYAAGCVTLADAARILRVRGLAMRNACPNGTGGMVALLGADIAKAQELAQESAQATAGVCDVANDNAPGQVVLSGHIPAIQYASDHARAKGIKKAVILDVSGPFHSRLMQPAEHALMEAMESVSFHAPVTPIVQNLTAKPVENIDEIKKNVIQQVTHRVCWRESVQTMLVKNTDVFIECGAGGVLAGLVKRIAREWNESSNVEAISFGDQGDLSTVSSVFLKMWR